MQAKGKSEAQTAELYSLSDWYKISVRSIPGVQNLSYTYDAVGNIKTTNDGATATVLTYDGLDRLIQATIGNDRYEYTYNPTGNLMDMVKNNASKKFVYNNLAHAPSTIFDNSAGADVYHITSLSTNSKNRTIEYYLVNDMNTTTTGVATTADFGNGKTFTAANLSVNTSILFLLQQNYTSGGAYALNITATTTNSTDYETTPLSFGLHALSLRITGANVSNRTFEFDITSDVNETLPNVTYTCTGGITGTGINLTGTLATILSRNYTSSGPQSMTCNATSTNGNDTKTITFTIPGLTISPIDTLWANTSRRVISATATNSFYPLTPTMTLSGENVQVSTGVNLSTNGQLMIFAMLNNTVGTGKATSIGITAGNDTQNTTSVYDVKSLSIDSYQRTDTSNLSKIYLYAIRNLWDASTLSWTFSDPGIANSTTLANNQSLFVFIASNYTQGEKTPTMNATIQSYSNSIADHFISKPLAITSLLTLTEAPSGAVTELAIQNYAGGSPGVTWQYNTGQQTLTNTTNVSSALFVYVQTNYTTSGVYSTFANASTTSYRDNRTGVITQ